MIAELSRDEDQPWDLEQKTILPLVFGPKAPYGHPVIGQAVHVRRATAEIIKSHYDKWYHPNNASLIVCGGFDPDEAMVKIKELFSSIPEEKLPPRNPPVPIEHTEAIHYEFKSKFDVARMIMGFTTIPSTDPDLPALEVCQSVLSGGKTSRFYKDLVEGAEIASSAESFDTWGRYTGWFGVQLELLPGKDRKEAEKLVLAELQQLADTPIHCGRIGPRAAGDHRLGRVRPRERPPTGRQHCSGGHAEQSRLAQGIAAEDRPGHSGRRATRGQEVSKARTSGRRLVGARRIGRLQ